jgi:arginine/lysine/ornithine decarboxylase
MLKNPESQQDNDITPLIQPEVMLSPQEAFYKKSKIVNIEDIIGLVSKETIVSYPPGIPVLIAGELIKQEHLNLLKKHAEISVVSD